MVIFLANTEAQWKITLRRTHGKPFFVYLLFREPSQGPRTIAKEAVWRVEGLAPTIIQSELAHLLMEAEKLAPIG